ncbi:glycosyltransferase family 1 protein [Stipitochalara longipes BDJ]|nr:glycosyltransferase family 1 protein [Stipitochalara longipes BDJ]
MAEHMDTSDESWDHQPPSYEIATSDLVKDAVGVADDGRIEIDLDSKIARALSRFIPNPPDYSKWEPAKEAKNLSWTVKLNIVIQVVGSRGDVQPFIALGNELQKFGHRVRLATHNTFQKFVQDHGLEFYPIGGNPEELMAYMVKNPGLLPSIKSLRQGEIARKRLMVGEMLNGCWESCVQLDPIHETPFVADAIIANPPSFAHVHCAQALGIPVHLMFTMPWSNTRAFPHPLASLKNSGADPSAANYVSYSVVELMTWQGLGDVINKFRKTLDLEPVPAMEGPNLASSLKIPFTYCWSPSLVPKPTDWPPHIALDICGFFFRDPPNYQPTPDLDAFLRAGPPPVYIGFGSIVIDDPEKMSSLLLQAIRLCGVRAIISRGWSKLGGPEMDNVFYLGDCPHEWLFQHVSAVIHHGGAGTTACGLLNGVPTTIVPFFGDQQFWGTMVAIAGAGPKPIPHKSLTTQNLAGAISYCLTPQALTAAQGIAARMRIESGVRTAVNSFHANLPIERLRCDLLSDQPAAWTYKRKQKSLKLSKVATQFLDEHLKIERSKLELYEPKPILIEPRRYDPVTSTTSAFMGVQMDVVEATAGLFSQPYKEYKSRQTQKASSLKSDSTSMINEASSLQSNGESSSRSSQVSKSSGSTAGAVAMASAKSFGNFYGKSFKGLAVDIPLAAAEGFKNIPALYGGQIRDNGPVTDWKSGVVVGGKSFFYGMTEGLTDIFVQPYKGARDEGSLGALKGIGKGTVALASKTGAGALGLVAYPGQGIAKSIRSAVRSKLRHSIEKAKHVEGEYLLKSAIEKGLDFERLIADFDRSMRND